MNLTRNHLYKYHIMDYEVLTHTAVRTMQEVFDVLSAPVEQMIKTLLLKSSDIYLLVGVPATKKICLKQLSQRINYNNLKLAPYDQIKKVTGFEPGAVPPFSLSTSFLPTFIDTSFFQFDYVFCGIGTHHQTLKINPQELLKLPGLEKISLF